MDKALSLLSPLEFDLATNRSVQATMRITIMDVEAYAQQMPDVMALPLYSVSARLNDRPTRTKGMKNSEYLWPARGMREFIDGMNKKLQLRIVK